MSLLKTPSPLDKDREIHWINAPFMAATPILTIVLSIYYLANHGIHWLDFAVFFFMYITTGMAITAGYHRYYSHRSYDCHWTLQLFYLCFGAAAIQNSILKWGRDHRIHHQKVDTFDDPYDINEGFFWAHIGWIFYKAPKDRDFSCVPDLRRDKLVLWQDRHNLPLIILVGFGLPTLMGAMYGRPFAGFLFGGLVRTVVVQHLTFFINSLAHYFGTQPYSLHNTARDSWWLAFLTYGEGYHNFHHRFSADYRNGVRWYHFDPTKWWIRTFKTFGIVTRLTRYRDDLILKARIETDIQRIQNKIAHAPEKLSLRIEQRLDAAREQLESAYAKWEHAKTRYKKVKRQVLAGSLKGPYHWKLRRQEYKFEFQAAQARWAMLIAAFSRFSGPHPIT